ncbi:MAG: YdgA family protein [bacterium]|nr:YdgA family protein [bacterium]MCP5068978.1 YdgA family protein [bacterium]
MKKTFLVLLMVGLALSGLSVWSGLRVEATHQELIAALEERPQLRVLSSEFERGLLDSTARTEFELRGAAGALFQRPLEWAGQHNVRQRIGFHLEHHIEHGPVSLWRWFSTGAVGTPIVAHVHSTLTLDQEAWSELAAAFGKLPAAQFHVRVAADGHVRGRLSMPAADLQPRNVEPGDTPRWVGKLAEVRGDLEVVPESDLLQVALQAGGLHLGGNDMSLDVGEWTFHLRLPLGESTHPSRGEHVVQKLAVAWPALEPTDPMQAMGGPTRIALEGIAWTTEGRSEELWVEAGFDQVQWNSLEATDVRIGIEAIRDLDPQEPTPEAHLATLLGFLPELNITDFGGQTSEGPFHVSGRVRFDPTVAEGGSNLEGELELRLPSVWTDALAGDDEAVLGAWIDAGELERDAEGYLGDLRFEPSEPGEESESNELATRLLGLLPELPVGSLAEEAEEEASAVDEVAAESPAVTPEDAPGDPALVVSQEEPAALSALPEELPEEAGAAAPPAAPAP